MRTAPTDCPKRVAKVGFEILSRVVGVTDCDARSASLEESNRLTSRNTQDLLQNIPEVPALAESEQVVHLLHSRIVNSPRLVRATNWRGLHVEQGLDRSPGTLKWPQSEKEVESN